jgi:hypothetical protein
VQSTGIWRIYGEKTYEPVELEEYVKLVDPRIEGVASESIVSYLLEGAAIEFEVLEGALSGLQLRMVTGETLVLPGAYEVESVYTVDCDIYEDCKDGVYVPGTLDDLVRGNYVQVELQRVYGENWKIHQLNVELSEWETLEDLVQQEPV